MSNGLITLRFDFGSGEQVIRMNSPKVADGSWHHLRFTYRRDFESRTSVSATSTTLNLGDQFWAWFGGEVVRNGFVGCLRNIMVDSFVLPIGDPVTNLYNVRLNCDDNRDAMSSITTDADEHRRHHCEPGFCLNGGTCIEDDQGGSGDHACICPANHGGLRCEISAMWCERDPCLNGGSCETLRNGYRCRCTPGYTGI
ncbi:unnamed protein product [Soboliphyme baturini]|uniref:LAM_G_DOMAIN domain-containing protein n=1 Tax=Soboliphyme baturini TaxID=241478 RepID=A0A183IQR4_9BILA|nr:unnamed protein product [Soboliphyme baturini]